jgi:uncharacterized protein with HEPN domain
MKDNYLFLNHILDAINDIEDLTEKGEVAFFRSVAFKHAVCRCFEIIGEAATRCTKDFQAENAHVDWRRVIGLRNIIIHQYHNVNYGTVWNIAVDELPSLKAQLLKIMEKNETAFIEHIYNSITKIIEYTQCGKIEFLKSVMIQDAVFRNLRIISEATSRCGLNIRHSHSQIPWDKMINYKKIVSDNYDMINMETIWDLTQNDIPPLKSQLQTILKRAL